MKVENANLLEERGDMKYYFYYKVAFKRFHLIGGQPIKYLIYYKTLF